MKKTIVLVLSFFILSSNVFASSRVNTLEMQVNIDETGVAQITETWVVPKQERNTFEKVFPNLPDVTIFDIVLSDANNSNYQEVKDFDDRQDFTYSLIKEKNKQYLRFTAISEANTFTIKYKIEGIISKYLDTSGINWPFIESSKIMEYGVANIFISSPYSFSEANTALYGIGKNLSIQFRDGKIHIFANNLLNKSSIRLMTTFTDITYNNPRNVHETFDEAYKKALREHSIFNEILTFITGVYGKIIFVIIGIIIIILIINKVIKRYRKHDEFEGIETIEKKWISSLEEVNYYDTIPCNGDLYKMAFVAGYFKLLKNRSDLIGAILLKWIYEGKCFILNEQNRVSIKLADNQFFERSLDNDLYQMLISAQAHGSLDNYKVKRYVNDHYLRVMTWFNMGFNEVINEEFSRGHIKRNCRRKTVNLILGEEIVDMGEKLQGLKKYLLHFNQVPRQTQLNEEGYMYLLVCAELLGIGTEVAKEILRKNPDNLMAKQLLSLESVKHIYRLIYQSALIPYKQVVKKKSVISSYDEEMEKLIKQTPHEEERKSKL